MLFMAWLQKIIVGDKVKLALWLESFGTLSILVYVVVQGLTIIIAPIGGSAAALAMIALYGPVKGNLIVYLVSSFYYTINFLIAKRFGKKIVGKILKEEGLQKVEKYTSKLNLGGLILLRLFLTSIYDYVSYATGLTKISLSEFILVTLLAGIPGVIFTYFAFSVTPNLVYGVLILFGIPGVIFLLALPFKKQIKKRLGKSGEIFWPPQEI